MKRTAALLFLSAFAASVCCADMIEVKNKGFLNGEVLSQDDKEVKFKDAKEGKVRTYARSDVDYIDIDKKDTGTKKQAVELGLKEKAEQAIEAAKRMPRQIKKSTDSVTQKIMG